MAPPSKPEILEKDIGGFKKFQRVLKLFEGLHTHACDRDLAGNRKLHYDQYIGLILLYYFNPILTSLRGIQQASELKKVQKKLKCPRASLGSLSDASRVFDPDLLRGIIGDLVDQLKPLDLRQGYDQVSGVLTLVDGTLLPALPKLVEAMWLGGQHKAFKIHTHFEAVKSVPVHATVTTANASERQVLIENLSADRVYVIDRGYYSFDVFRQILDAKSSFVCRVRENCSPKNWESLAIPKSAEKAGIISDCVGTFQTPAAQQAKIDQTQLRRVAIRCTPHPKRNKGSRGGPGNSGSIIVLTNLMDVPAEVIALIYEHRWAIETFFRFFKHTLGCRHLISHDVNGIHIQVYVGIIACLLIALWTGKKPTLRTYEMVCFYFVGMADLDELTAHIEKLQTQPA